MNAEIINPFVRALFDIFETMVGLTPVREAPYIKNNSMSQGDVTGVIGFAEKDLLGSVALSFSNKAAIKVYNAMMDENITKLTPGVQDLVGELTNIVAGGAKKEFAKDGLSFHISIPIIVVGRNHAIRHQFNVPVLVVPFKLDEDTFILEVSMKIEKHKPKPLK